MVELVIPNKLLFRIGEVCKLLSLEPYVLRFWEKEFPMLAPTKGANGRRMYRQKDVEMVIAIRNLLYSEGFTIAGARKVLVAGGGADLRSSAGQGKQPAETENTNIMTSKSGKLSGDKLTEVKQDLRDILTILNRRC